MELREDLKDWMDDHKEWSDEIEGIEGVYLSCEVEDKPLELQAEIERLQGDLRNQNELIEVQITQVSLLQTENDELKAHVNSQNNQLSGLYDFALDLGSCGEYMKVNFANNHTPSQSLTQHNNKIAIEALEGLVNSIPEVGHGAEFLTVNSRVQTYIQTLKDNNNELVSK